MQKKTIKKQPKKASPISLSFKYGAIFLLLTLSIIIVACGSNTSGTTITSAGATTTATTTSKATPTINFSKVNQLSPTPTLPPQWCGIWVTNASPVFSSGGSIPIYAKFVSQQGGNPVGIAGAAVSITIQWGDLSTPISLQTITTSDGLATTYASMQGHSFAVNKLSLITATFSSGSVSCSVGTDRPASFALVAGSTAKPKNTAKTTYTIPTQTPQNTVGNTNNLPNKQSLTSNK